MNFSLTGLHPGANDMSCEMLWLVAPRSWQHRERCSTPVVSSARMAELPRRVGSMAFGAAEAAQQLLFERCLGVRTTGNVYDNDGVAKTGRVFYAGSQWFPVRRALGRLAPSPSDVFVDLGAGKGQALLTAARLPYGRVIGVEFDEDLATAASENLRRARSRPRARSIEVVRTDALAWALPEDTSLIFMYCPFVGELFHRVLEGVFNSHARSPRELFIVYSFPFEHNWLLSTGRVEVVDVQPARWPTRPRWWETSWVMVTYRVLTPGCPDQRRSISHRSASDPGRRRWSAQNDHRFWVGEPGRAKVHSHDQ